MTLRQKALKLFYPVLMLFTKKKRATILRNVTSIAPAQPFQQLTVQLSNGKLLRLDTLKGKKILLVNTASDCGFTAQYAELQHLYQQANGELEIIGFPANNFKEQEKGSDEEIATFCSVNFGINFPLAKKSSVVRGSNQNEIFRWLSDKNLNGWNNQPPEWNFSKYLVNEEGILTHYFSPSVSPLSSDVLTAINE